MRKKIFFSEDDKNKILEMYKNKNSMKKIAQAYNCSTTTISKLLNKMPDFVRTSQSEYMKDTKKERSQIRKYNIDLEYFNNIDDGNKAYILGLIASDGNISSRDSEVTISLLNTDNSEMILLQKISECMKYEKGITIYNSRKEFVNLKISCLEIKERLIDIGITPNKTFNMSIEKIMSNIPICFHKDFVRGYFDGDGSISYYTRKKTGKIEPNFNITMPTSNADDFIRYMNVPFDIFKSIDKRTDGKICQIRNGSRDFIKYMYEYLYKDSPHLFLERKKNKFEEYLTIINYL